MWKKIWAYYKKEKEQEKRQKTLLAKKMDYAFLQQIVDKVDNQGVIIEIDLADKTHLVVRPRRQELTISNGGLFNGDDFEV